MELNENDIGIIANKNKLSTQIYATQKKTMHKIKAHDSRNQLKFKKRGCDVTFLLYFYCDNSGNYQFIYIFKRFICKHLLLTEQT